MKKLSCHRLCSTNHRPTPRQYPVLASQSTHTLTHTQSGRWLRSPHRQDCWHSLGEGGGTSAAGKNKNQNLQLTKPRGALQPCDKCPFIWSLIKPCNLPLQPSASFMRNNTFILHINTPCELCGVITLHRSNNVSVKYINKTETETITVTSYCLQLSVVEN